MRGQYPTIFGDTYPGVPNPEILHDHPYPTRYHGPIWTYPYFGKPYRDNPYASPPYAGFGKVNAFGGCGCGGVPKAGGSSGVSGFGENPDGLGALDLTQSVTGSVLLDALVGAGLGAVVAPSDRVVWAAGGAVAAMVLGALGMAGTVGVGVYARK